MQKHWAMVTWNGINDMADQEFTHVVWSVKDQQTAEAAAQAWGEKHLSPAAAHAMRVQYLGRETD